MVKIICKTNHTIRETECFIETTIEEIVGKHKPEDIVRIKIPIKIIKRAIDIHERNIDKKETIMVV